MSYALDGILILIPVIAAIIGYRRGFLQSLVQVVGCVAALALAFTLSSPCATFAYDNWLADGLEAKLAERIEETAQTAVSDQWEALQETLPAPLANLLENAPQILETMDETGVVELPSSTAIAEKLMETAVRPLALILLRCVAFFLIFAVVLLLAALLKKMMKPLSKLPIIHQADGILGGTMGAIKGAVFAVAFVVAVQFVAAVIPANPYLSQETIENTWIVDWVADQNPLTDIFV